MQNNRNSIIRCPWGFVGKCLLIPAIIFLVLLLGTLVFDFVFGMNIPQFELYLNFGIQCAVWFGLSGGFLFASARIKAKLKRLKREGECYDGVVEALNPVFGVRIMHYQTVRADCSYVNRNGKKCLVRSRALLHENGDLVAQVYVDYNNPEDYAIEMTKAATPQVDADFDYR